MVKTEREREIKMMTIMYNNKGIRININLIKEKIKKVILKALTVLAIICGLLGVLYIYDSAGASEIGGISIREIMTKTTQGLGLSVISYASIFVRNALQ